MNTEKFFIISKKEKDGFYEYGIRNSRRKSFIINSPNEYTVGAYIFVEYLYKEGKYLEMQIL